jgi:hypothetical protein
MKKACYNFLLNITRSWVTSLLGVVLAVLLLTVVYQGKAKLEETYWGWAVVALLLGVNEKKLLELWKGKGGGGAAAGVVVLCVAVFALGGCRSAKTPVPVMTREHSDSTVTTTTYVDRPVLITEAGDTVYLTVPAPCPELAGKTYTTKKGRTRATAAFDTAGNLTVTCAEDSLRLIVTARDKTITQLRRVKTADTIKLTNTVYKVHWYDLWARWLAGLAIVLLAFRAYRLWLTWKY